MSNGQQVVQFTVDGRQVEVPDVGDSLLGVLRDHLGITSVKDGCSPQGQCGCCTVLVDGQPRVACVTPARRIKGRVVQTVDGLDADRADEWAGALCSTGGSQCGFCTPGIVVRLEGLKNKIGDDADRLAEHDPVRQALLAHLCRCTGWQTIVEAWDLVVSGDTAADAGRDLAKAAERASIEGGTAQVVDTGVALGRGGFAADTVPGEHLIAISTGSDDDGQAVWSVGETLFEARTAAGKVQGRRTTAEHSWPIEVPEGDWVATIRTTWVDPAYLETDASWCEPGGEPSSPLGNGGAFGAKLDTPVAAAAQRLANEHGRTVLALASREDSVNWGPKRPPIAAGIRADGSAVIRVARTERVAETVSAFAPDCEIEEVDVVGPPTSASIRAAGWAEAAVLKTALAPADQPVEVTSPSGATATAEIVDGTIRVTVRCGEVLDEVMLRSYCIGATHMAWSWLTSEALTVDDDGVVHDLTVRSFGVLRAIDMPPVEVVIDHTDDGPAVNGSDAVFAAVAGAGWRASGYVSDWPVGPITIA